MFFIPIQAQFNIFQYFLHYVYRETFYSLNGRKAVEGINQRNQKWNLENQKYFKGAQNKNGQGETSSDDGLLYEEVICIPIYLKKYFLRRCLLWLLSFDRYWSGIGMEHEPLFYFINYEIYYIFYSLTSCGSVVKYYA